MLNKRGVFWDNLTINYVVYFILVFVFFIFAFLYVTSFQDGEALWEDFYAKQIVLALDTAEPEQDVWIDMSQGARIASGNKFDVGKMVIFDNVNNLVRVDLGKGRSTSFSYFNDADVVNWSIESPSKGGGAEVTRLYFKVVEARKDG